jgi:hypothetical protein
MTPYRLAGDENVIVDLPGCGSLRFIPEDYFKFDIVDILPFSP